MPIAVPLDHPDAGLLYRPGNRVRVEGVIDCLLESLAREALLVRLYERREISSIKAAQLLGISPRALLDLLGQYHVSEFGEELDLEAETQGPCRP